MKTNTMVEKGYHADEYLWIRDEKNNIVVGKDGLGCKLEYSDGFEELDAETEYVVPTEAWITCRNKSIKIFSSDSGIEVEVFELGYEDRDSLASIYSAF